MNVVEISAAREQMGRALGDWVSSPDMSYQLLPGSWYFLSGLPSADANLAMVHADDEDVLNETLNAITRMDVPTILFLAADGKKLSEKLPDEWKRVGNFPFMTKQLHDGALGIDPRVSVAKVGDTNDVVKLLSESYLLDPYICSFLTDTLKNPDSVSDIWVLRDEGVAVSTVTTTRVDDALTVWCMGTPPQHARKGYGKALLNSVLAQSATQGADVGLLGATEAGKPLYDATGWETLEGWEVYVNGLADH